MWRVTRVTFKYHGTLGNLIGAPTTHLNSCLRIFAERNYLFNCLFLLQIRLAAFFFLWSFSPSDRAWHGSCCCCCCFFALNFTNTAGVLYSNISVLYFMGFAIVLLYHSDTSSSSGGACSVVHLKRLQAPCTSPYSIAAKCNALSINHWTVCCFHNGVVKARSGS